MMRVKETMKNLYWSEKGERGFAFIIGFVGVLNVDQPSVYPEPPCVTYLSASAR